MSRPVQLTATQCPGLKQRVKYKKVNKDMETQTKACINYGYCGRPSPKTGGHRMVLTDRNQYAMRTSCSSNDSNYAHRLLVLAHLLQTIVVYPQGDHWCYCHWRGSPLVLNCKYYIPEILSILVYFGNSGLLQFHKYPHHATNAAWPQPPLEADALSRCSTINEDWTMRLGIMWHILWLIFFL